MSIIVFLYFHIYTYNTRYKYYLSFENSVCLGYVSEKVRKAYIAHSVPIVLGGADYDSILPPHSYINAMEFGSPKDLAEYLKYLDQNEEKYLEYFWWRKHYQ